MSSRSGSSRRKPQQTVHLRKGRKKLEDDSESDSEADQNGNDSDVPDLPEGTVIVNPEPVDDSSNNSSRNRKATIPLNVGNLLDRVTCTSCGKQMNPHNHGAIRRHKALKVLQCKKCYKFLKSGEITQDDDGLDEQCCWCGQGGRLYGCDFCNHAFCRACIMRNFGRSEIGKLDSDNGKWRCYYCCPMKLEDKVDQCNKVLDLIEKIEEKEKMREKEAKLKTKDTKPERESRSRSSTPLEKIRINIATPDKPKIALPVQVVSSETGKMKTMLPAPVKQKGFSASSVNNTGKPAVSQPEPIVIVDETPPRKPGSVLAKVLEGPATKFPVNKTVQPRPEIVKIQKVQMGLAPHPVMYKPIQPMPPVGHVTVESFLQEKNLQPTSISAPPNNTIALKKSINSGNVVEKVKKMKTVASSLSLALNSISTDMEISVIQGQNAVFAMERACIALRNGMDVLFSAVREIFNVPVYTSRDMVCTSLNDQSLKTESFDIHSSTPVVKMDPARGDNLKGILDVSSIPITIDDSDSENATPKKPAKMAGESTVVDMTAERVSLNSKEKEVKPIVVDGNDTVPFKDVLKVTGDPIPNAEIDSGADDSGDNDNGDVAMETEDRVSAETKDGNGARESTNETSRTTENGVLTDSEDSNDKMDSKYSENKEEKRNSRKNERKASDKKKKDEICKKQKSKKIENSDSDTEEVKSKCTSKTKSKENIKSVSEIDDIDTEVTKQKSKERGKTAKQDQEKELARIKPTALSKTKSVDKENVAAQLDLLKEMADELSEMNKTENGDGNESDSEEKESRKSREKSSLKSKENKSGKKSKSTEEDNDSSGKSTGKEEKREKKTGRNDEKTYKSGKGQRKQAKDDDEDDDDDETDEDKKKMKKSLADKPDSTSEESDDTDSSDEDDCVQRRPRKKKVAAKKGVTTKKDTENSESDSDDFDPELEKDIKSLEKETKVRKSRTSKKTEKQENKTSQSASKDDAMSKKKGKKTDEDSLSSGSEDEEEEEAMEEEDDDDKTEEEDFAEKLEKVRKENEAAKKELEAELEEEEEEEDNDDDNDDDSDPEVSFPKLQSPKKGKIKVVSDSGTDSDIPSKKKRINSKLLDAKLSDSDSDFQAPKKKRKQGGKGRGKRKHSSEESEKSEEDEEEDSDSDNKEKKGKGKRSYTKTKGKKRRRIRKMKESSSEDEKEPGADDVLSDENADAADDDEDDDDDDDDEKKGGGFLKRKKIRKVQKNKKLADETKAARKAEEERRKRIEERQKEFNSYVEVEDDGDGEELPDGVEREKMEKGPVNSILGSPRKVPVTTKLILEMDKDKKKELIKVDSTLIKKLKPHQVDAVRFMYNCMVESLDRIDQPGAGCILAHCMGLGKTLSVISFVHTMLKHRKLTKMSKVMVVCPLNTVLNWVNEFEIWQDDLDFQIDVYELSSVKENFRRAQVLKDWHSGPPGVMILGYDMYRNLTLGSHCKNKKQKAIFYETLCEPGPDIVVCDEGHILKNDATSISKAMNKVRSQRRVVLTGTPLQNNLGEYHCMVNFVKPNLLGTRKEFGNRFVNPITNGQCSDSTPADVRLMKRRAHILHEMLAGCVQRKDYSALTKFLPPKFEYVVSVRLAKVQMQLYEKYLELSGLGAFREISGKGARLFKDYQALMRIWTHPWVLKLDQVRQENKMKYDDSEDSFIDDSGEESEDSFVSEKSTPSEVSAVEIDSDDSGPRRSRRSRRRKSSSSDSDDSNEEKKKQKNEIVKKWKTRSRGGEEDGAGPSWADIIPVDDTVVSKNTEWWGEYVSEGDERRLELGGKMILLFEILKMCEEIGDKVLVFSQSLLSLDIIEDFLEKIDQAHNSEAANKETVDGEEEKKENGDTSSLKKENGDGDKADTEGDKPEAEKEDPLLKYRMSWTKGADYFRMDGSTNAQNRKAAQNMFNDEENYRARLFLISTKAGSLGINLVAANRVIIFDASWNPSHDIQSIFRVYRFGQLKPVYVYRFLAQGTMEEKIYERQVTKQSLSQRVVDEHQIERHFTASDLQELYKFQPDRLDDPNRKPKPLPMLPKDHMLAELMSSQKDWIVTFHEHDSLLENLVEEELSEEDRKAAWEEYENEKKGIFANRMPMMNMMGNMAGAYQGMYGGMNMGMMMPGLQGLTQAGIIQIVQDLKMRFPNLPPNIFQQRVQAVLHQVLTQQMINQNEMQRNVERRQMEELQRLNQLKQQIQRQQSQVEAQQRGMGLAARFSNMTNSVDQSLQMQLEQARLRPGEQNLPGNPPS